MIVSSLSQVLKPFMLLSREGGKKWSFFMTFAIKRQTPCQTSLTICAKRVLDSRSKTLKMYLVEFMMITESWQKLSSF